MVPSTSAIFYKPVAVAISWCQTEIGRAEVTFLLKCSDSVVRADGTPRQCNDGKWDFTINEDNKGNVIVEIGFPKYMDTSLLDLDVQPTYFRVTIRKPEKHDKILQLLLPAEVRPDECEAKRSQNTGALQLTIPKLHWVKPGVDEDGVRRKAGDIPLLEAKSVDKSKGGPHGVVNIKKMTKESPNAVEVDIRPVQTTGGGDDGDESDFEDDPDCPPLE